MKIRIDLNPDSGRWFIEYKRSAWSLFWSYVCNQHECIRTFGSVTLAIDWLKSIGITEELYKKTESKTIC